MGLALGQAVEGGKVARELKIIASLCSTSQTLDASTVTLRNRFGNLRGYTIASFMDTVRNIFASSSVLASRFNPFLELSSTELCNLLLFKVVDKSFSTTQIEGVDLKFLMGRAKTEWKMRDVYYAFGEYFAFVSVVYSPDFNPIWDCFHTALRRTFADESIHPQVMWTQLHRGVRLLSPLSDLVISIECHLTEWAMKVEVENPRSEFATSIRDNQALHLTKITSQLLAAASSAGANSNKPLRGANARNPLPGPTRALGNNPQPPSQANKGSPLKRAPAYLFKPLDNFCSSVFTGRPCKKHALNDCKAFADESKTTKVSLKHQAEFDALPTHRKGELNVYFADNLRQYFEKV